MVSSNICCEEKQGEAKILKCHWNKKKKVIIKIWEFIRKSKELTFSQNNSSHDRIVATGGGVEDEVSDCEVGVVLRHRSDEAGQLGHAVEGSSI